MEFTVEFYLNRDGRSPVQEFLDALRLSDPDDFAAVLAGLAKLRNRPYHRPPLSKPLGHGLFELRQVGKLNTRVLYAFYAWPANCIGAWHSEQGVGYPGSGLEDRDGTNERLANKA